jgi:hypothetical protein
VVSLIVTDELSQICKIWLSQIFQMPVTKITLTIALKRLVNILEVELFNKLKNCHKKFPIMLWLWWDNIFFNKLSKLLSHQITVSSKYSWDENPTAKYFIVRQQIFFGAPFYCFWFCSFHFGSCLFAKHWKRPWTILYLNSELLDE